MGWLCGKKIATLLNFTEKIKLHNFFRPRLPQIISVYSVNVNSDLTICDAITLAYNATAKYATGQ